MEIARSTPEVAFLKYQCLHHSCYSLRVKEGSYPIPRTTQHPGTDWVLFMLDHSVKSLSIFSIFFPQQFPGLLAPQCLVPRQAFYPRAAEVFPTTWLLLMIYRVPRPTFWASGVAGRAWGIRCKSQSIACAI